MAQDSRSTYDRAIGVTPEDHDMPWGRYSAIRARIAEAIQAGEWAAVQAYAMLLIAEKMPSEPLSVQWNGWEDHADRIGFAVGQALSG